ncbi:MAG: hypothetical protein MJD61_10500 [Proteobacteria bacterium]|nr:hypothetical protein [Pseudomonadota bacterium]
MTAKIDNSLLSAVLILVAGAAFAPSEAQAAVRAYVWANNPTAPSYTPDPTYSNNPNGRIHIQRRSQGRYDVTFAGVARRRSNVQVTSYGSGATYCKVLHWSSHGSDLVVSVGCFGRRGRPRDSQYTVLALAGGTGPRMAYAWASRPGTASYPADQTYSHNQGGPVQIRRNGLGVYDVTFPRLAQNKQRGSTVQVTAYGPGDNYCKVGHWSRRGDLVVRVLCFHSNGGAADAQFTILAMAN